MFLRMVVNENENENENADVNVEVMRNAAKNRRHAHGDHRGRRADGHGRLDRGSPPRASGFYYRRCRCRCVGLRIGSCLYRPRPFSVYHHHDCRTHFSFVVDHLHRRPSPFVRHCRRIRCRRGRGNFAVCPAPSSIHLDLGGRVVDVDGRCRCCVGGSYYSQPRHPDEYDICLCRRSYGISCANLVKESVVALLNEEAVADGDRRGKSQMEIS